jgi:small subunit ribosomal protein S16
MATRIRLQRHGKKSKAFFHIVVADSRSKRDGRYIEKLGTYNPNTNPATIMLDFERSVHWVSVGAEASDTARAILSYNGVLMKEHLMRGVNKGALTAEQMEAKFAKWQEDKSGKITVKVDRLAKAKSDTEKAKIADEIEKNQARAAAIAAAVQPEVEEAPAAEESTTETLVEAANEAVGATLEATDAVVEAATEAVLEATEEVAEAVAEVAEETVEAAKEETTSTEEESEEKKEA